MSNNHLPVNERERAQAALVEALLTSLYQGTEQDTQTRITNILDQLEDQPESTGHRSIAVKSPLSKSVGRRWMTRPGLVAIATAIAIFAVLFFPTFNQSQSALATIRRSLEQITQDIGLHYSMLITFRSRDNNRVEYNGDLYVRGNDRYAVRREGKRFGADFWLGSENHQAWVVPPVGPILEGDQVNLVRWMNRRQDLDTPFLHVSTILERMKIGYRLERLPPEEITNQRGEQIQCQHIVGRLRGAIERNFPDEIELWASKESGHAARVVATWDLREGEAGRESIEINFVDQTELPEDWFLASGHSEVNRRRLNFNSGEDE